MYKIDTTPRSWDDALKALMPQATPEQQPQATQVPTAAVAIVKDVAPQRVRAAKTEAQIKAAEKAKARKGFWRAVARILTWLGNFLTSRARDLALVAIVAGTGVAVFQGSYASATLFGFTGWSATAFALMPDALMVISAAKMREKGVSAVQRKEARFSMYYGLSFSLFSNMIAALHMVMPGVFTVAVLACGAVLYHASTVIFLWRAVETVTKTREDAPSVKRNPKARKASRAS